MASVDAFVHAGDQETGGLAVLEAMACGTPVVVRAAGGLAETVSDGCGLSVDSGDPVAWAEAIATLFASRDTVNARALGLARARAQDWSAVLDSLSRRYLHLMARRRGAVAS
jgi:alpha-1,6-mannosyltransferase